MPTLCHCGDQSHAITTAAPLSCRHNSTFHRALTSALGAGPTPQRDRSRLPRARALGASTLPDLPARGEILLFNSLMTVLGLTCNTRAVSQIPLAFMAMSTIWRFTSADCPE